MNPAIEATGTADKTLEALAESLELAGKMLKSVPLPQGFIVPGADLAAPPAVPWAPSGPTKLAQHTDRPAEGKPPTDDRVELVSPMITLDEGPSAEVPADTPVARPPDVLAEEFDRSVGALAVRYEVMAKDPETAKVIAAIEFVGDRLPEDVATASVAAAMTGLVSGLTTEFCGVAALAAVVRKHQPAIFDRWVDEALQAGCFADALMKPQGIRSLANLAAVLHVRFVADMVLDSLDILQLDAAIGQLLMAKRIRLTVERPSPFGATVGVDTESRKQLELSLKYEQEFQRTINQLRARHRPGVADLHVHAAGSAAVQVNVGGKEPPSRPDGISIGASPRQVRGGRSEAAS